MSKKIKLISVLVLIVFLSGGVFAQMSGNSRMGNHQRMAKRGSHSPMMLYKVLKNKQQELKVTNAQLNKIKELAFNWEKDMINYRSSNASLRLELKKVLNEEKPNYKKIRILMDKIGAARTDYFINHLKVKNQIKNILTKEQLDKLAKMRMDMRKRFMMNRFKNNRRNGRKPYHN
jgi:Spy/CpxP family protein refolding chaperone